MKKQYIILFTSGELADRRFAVKSEGLIIGSSADADVRCTGAGILAEHVTLLPQLDTDEILLHRQRSASVVVNGKILTNSADVILHDDDDVKLGKSLRFILKLEETAAERNYSSGNVNADDSDATADDSTADAESDSATEKDGNITRYVSEAELADIREYVDIQKRKKKVLTLSCIIFLILLIAGMCTYKLASYESELTWPGSLEKKIQDEEYFVSLGKYGKFLIYYPKNKHTIVRKNGNNCEVMTLTGRNRDVPFHLELHVNTLENGFRTSKEKSFENWKHSLQTKKTFIISDNPSIEFFSKNSCGIPGYTFSYQRQYNNLTWNGVAIYIRYEDKEIILLKEVFSRDWERARSLLNGVSCISFANMMVMNYWEIPENINSHSLSTLSKIILRELAKDSEQSSWKELRNSISSALCLAHIAKNQDDINAFETALHVFHQEQTAWFTRRCLYFNYCKYFGITKEMQLIRVESLDRFFGLSDYRYNKICNDDWSL